MDKDNSTGNYSPSPSEFCVLMKCVFNSCIYFRHLCSIYYINTKMYLIFTDCVPKLHFHRLCAQVTFLQIVCLSYIFTDCVPKLHFYRLCALVTFHIAYHCLNISHLHRCCLHYIRQHIFFEYIFKTIVHV